MFDLFKDLDRTLLPNGNQPETPIACQLFAKLGDRFDVVLSNKSHIKLGV